jgi:hypothetical protein
MPDVKPNYDPHPLFEIEEGHRGEHRDIVFLGFKRRNAAGRLISLPGTVPAKDVKGWADVARWWGGGHYLILARDGRGHFAGQSPAGDKLHHVEGPELPFTRDRVPAPAPPPRDPPVYRMRVPIRGQATNGAPVKQVKAVRHGTLPGGLECYIGDDGERYLSQRGIVQCVRTSKAAPGTRGAEDGKIDRLVARLTNPSDELTRGAEVRMEIPQAQGGVVRANGRPARFLIAFCAAYTAALTAGTLREDQVPMAHRCVGLLAAFAQKGIEAMVDEACGVLAHAPQGGLPADVARTDELRGIVRDEIASALQRTDVRGMIREELRSASTPKPIDLSAVLTSSGALPWRTIREIAKKAHVDPKTAQKRIRGEQTRPGVGARVDAVLNELLRQPPADRGAPPPPPSPADEAAAASATARSVVAELEARGLLPIVQGICRARDVALEVLCGNTVRSHRVTHARHEVWWTVRKHPERQYACGEIGRIFARHPSAIEAGILAHGRRLAPPSSPDPGA